MARKVTLPAKEINESVVSCEIDYCNRCVRVSIARLVDITRFDTNRNEVTATVVNNDIPLEYIVLENEMYDSLLSGRPSWAASEPEGMFSRESLWTCIDAIRSGQSLSAGVRTHISKDRL